MSYHFLLDLAIILMSTKLLGIITKRFHMPQVVGALFAGLLLGPAVLNILKETEFIKQMSELGVIALMFTAGLETDMVEMKKSGKAATIIAILGVLVPLIGGFLIATVFNKDGELATPVVLQNIFIGVILTATSVSITVETLKELGKLSGKVGNAILGAAIIDDILGIIALTIITSLADTSVNITWVLTKIVLFFVFAGLVGILFYKFFKSWTMRDDEDRRRYVIVAFVFCLLLAYIAEEFFGVADITGAFIGGLIISNTIKRDYIERRFETMSYLLLSPIFFASIGLAVELESMSLHLILFSIALLLIAVITKIIGCGLGAKLCGYANKEALQIGTGMISRGEVALIVATKGAAVGLLSTELFAPIVIMVVATTILTPIFLKLVFKSELTDSTLSKRASAKVA
ncbi:sodium:proton antiporter [Sporanaerobium hydrogeniformans]|uniref:Sodium:proton antiporter n=1 Tax=Sporanaerobium hydrogeniformans TaxID=3072179 RepID=A0AC61DAE0_9FIRM|nr:cation:proton antiporter [Sporanaerobium hydrogeniformans]PHV69688.1 sodium:proton antiporter [Sporanaerobium hydrogeniformans]